jgi:hypothetical protein
MQEPPSVGFPPTGSAAAASPSLGRQVGITPGRRV